MRNTIWTILLAVAATAGAAHAGDGIHLEGNQTNMSWPWNKTDGGNYRWDVYQNGYISSGTNSVYSGGMQLYVNENNFYWNNSTAVMSKDGREIEIGPWNYGNLKVYRRIYVDAKQAYCRWIDIFENPSTSDQSVNARYYSSLGNSVRTIESSTGGQFPAEKDFAFTTSGSSPTRPALAHIYASKSSKLKPQINCNVGSNSINMTYSFRVPAGKAVAICLFEAQRGAYADAVKAMKSFNPAAENASLPPALRKIILNIGGHVLSLETVELARDDQADLAVLRGGDELKGKIKNAEFVVETFYGQLKLPAERVVGLAVPTPDDPHVQLVLTDGQVLAGRFVNSPLVLVLENGNEMSLTPEKLASAAYRITPAKPDDIPLTAPMVVLRTGQQLFFKAADAAGVFHTEYGDVTIQPDALSVLHMDTPDGGLHRAVFRSGSVLSGLFTTEDLKLTLQLGPTLAIKRHLVSRFAFPPASQSADPERSVMQLRNDDELLGSVADASLRLTTPHGQVDVSRQDIAQLETVPGALGRVQIKLHSGSTVSGKLGNQTIRFKIDDGPELPIFIGHVVLMTCPPPPEKPQEPATQPGETPAGEPGAAGATPAAAVSRPTTKPAIAAAVMVTDAAVMVMTKEVAELQAQLLALRAQRAALEAQASQMIAAGKPNEAIATQERVRELQVMERNLAAKIAKLAAAGN